MRTTYSRLSGSGNCKNQEFASSLRKYLAAPLIISVMVLGRRFAYLNNAVLNPDEAVLMAWGLRSHESLIPFDSVVTNTSGPIWALFMGVIHQLGYPMTLPAVHLLSAVLTTTIILLLVHLLTPVVGSNTSTFLGLTLSVYFSTGGLPFERSVDFFSLSTELLPLVALTVAVVVWRAGRSPFLVGFLISAAVFSKYQFVIVAGTISVLIMKSWPKRLRVKFSVAFFGLPSILIALALLSRTSTQNILESLIAPYSYSTQGGLGQSDGIYSRLENLILTFWQHPITVLGCIYLLFLSSSRYSDISLRSRSRIVAKVVCAIGSIIVTLLVTTPVFPHYLAIPTFTAFLFVVVIFSNGDNQPPRYENNGLTRLTISFLVIVTLASWPYVFFQKGREVHLSVGKVLDATSSIRSPAKNNIDNQILTICPIGSRVFLWGWAAEVYGNYGWLPSSSLVETSQIIGNNYSGTFAKNIIKREFLQELPDCVVEVLGPNFFGGYTGENDSIQQKFPDLWNLIARQFDAHPIKGLPDMIIHRTRDQ